MKKVNHSMTRLIPLIIIAFATACSSPQSKKRQLIEQAELKLLTDTSFSPDSREARDLVKLYHEYSKQFPADSLSAEYLFKAGEISTGIGDYMKAIEYYDRLYGEHPSYSKAPVALFLQGFIYENNLGELEKAGAIYEKFLELYADHPIAPDVAMSLENLGKSPDELIRMFEEMEGKDTVSVSQVQ